MKPEEALSLSYVPNCDDADVDREWFQEECGIENISFPVMEIETDAGLVRRWEDGAAFLYDDSPNEGIRLAWGRFDSMNPDYEKNLEQAKKSRGRARFSCND